MNTQTKTVFKTALFTIAIGGMISVYSCKKEEITQAPKVTITASDKPVSHNDKAFYRATINDTIKLLVEDKDGKTVDLSNRNLAKGTSTCFDDSYAMTLIYRGYTVYGPCFNAPDGLATFEASWDLYLPEDVNPFVDATCIARLKLAPAGFISAPATTGFRTMPYTFTYIETVDIDGGGTMMKKWRIAAQTSFSENDYCGNFEITPSFRIKTDCPDLATIQPTLTTGYMGPNLYTIPDLWLSGGVNPQNGSKYIVFNPNIPLCGNGCHGYWKWATNYKIEYKLASSSTWLPLSGPLEWYNNNVISFQLNLGIIPSGTYQVRYKAVLKGDPSSGLWSEWVVPATTVAVP